MVVCILRVLVVRDFSDLFYCVYYGELVMPDYATAVLRRHAICRLHKRNGKKRENYGHLLISKNAYKLCNCKYVLKQP